MSILNDRRIRELCIAPTHRLDEDTYYRKLAETHSETLVHYADPRAHARMLKLRDERLRRESMVETTREERSAFVPMLTPFVDKQLRHVNGDDNGNKIISKGTSSYGYDVSLSEEFQIFTNVNGAYIDPKRPNPRCLQSAELLVDEYGDRFVWLPPNSYLLGRTVEYFNMPRNVIALCVGKSTYARSGVIVNVTPIEPGFQGHVVIEIANNTSLPLKVYANEGISQFLFLQGEDCEVSYADRKGKYQGQTGITHARV